jgi:hypothetical protein
MAAEGTSSGWIAVWAVALASVAGQLLVLYGIAFRERRWGDWRRLGRAAKVGAEHQEPRDRELRDMAVGETGYVRRWDVSILKSRRMYIRWKATLLEAPQSQSSFDPIMKVERLERGFALTVPAGVTFRTTSRILVLSFAPVIEIRQPSRV